MKRFSDMMDYPPQDIVQAILEGDYTSEDLTHLATHEDGAVRAGAAMHPNVDDVTMEKLSKDPDFQVRLCLLTNPRLKLPIIERLSDDPNPEVQAIAKTVLAML